MQVILENRHDSTIEISFYNRVWDLGTIICITSKYHVFYRWFKFTQEPTSISDERTSLVGTIESGENYSKPKTLHQSSMPAMWECKHNVIRSFVFFPPQDQLEIHVLFCFSLVWFCCRWGRIYIGFYILTKNTLYKHFISSR